MRHTQRVYASVTYLNRDWDTYRVKVKAIPRGFEGHRRVRLHDGYVWRVSVWSKRRGGILLGSDACDVRACKGDTLDLDIFLEFK